MKFRLRSKFYALVIVSMFFTFLFIKENNAFAGSNLEQLTTFKTIIGDTIIKSDTTWTKENSPFKLDGDVQIANGAKLVIEPGVKILGKNNRIRVFGKLEAIGHMESRILFESVNIDINGSYNDSPFIHIEKADIFKGSLYSPTGSITHGGMILKDSRVFDLGSYLYIWYPNTEVHIQNNAFVNSGGISIGNGRSVYITDNTFYNQTTDFAVENWSGYEGGTVLSGNSFLSTEKTALKLPTNYTSPYMIATHNYWGTIDESLIEKMIFDRNDDLASASYIAYKPYLLSPSPNSPKIDLSAPEKPIINEFTDKDTVITGKAEQGTLVNAMTIDNQGIGSAVVDKNGYFKIEVATTIPKRTKLYFTATDDWYNTSEQISISVKDSLERKLEVQRLSGLNRLSTAIEISKEGWPNGLEGKKELILARADNPADALSASSLSGAKDAPILLTYSSKLSSSVLDEIYRLNPLKVYVLGGQNAISNSVVDVLVNKGFNVERIAGKNRYQTAFNINKKAGVDTNSRGIVASGTSVADALSASSDAAINGVPIYLVTKDTIPVELPKNIKSVDIYGGLGVVSNKVEDELKQKGLVVNRYAGIDRYDTNRIALEKFNSNNVIVVRGSSVTKGKEDYPDSVAASGLAHRKNAVIALSHNTKYISNVKKIVNTFGSNKIFILGGNSAISNELVESYRSLFTDPIGKLKFTSLDLYKESVVIKNEDSRDINLTGWKLSSVVGNQSFYFPDNYILKKGANVKIVSGYDSIDNPPSQLLWTNNIQIWENSGDTARLYNPLNQLVSEIK